MNRVIRIILIVSGLIILVLFLIPLCLSASVNIGTLTGFAVAIVLLSYGVFFDRINIGIVSLYKISIGRLCCVVTALFIGAIAITAIIETICMISVANNTPPDDVTVVVLGCRIYNDRPSLSMVERLDSAYNYLTDNTECMCVLSGGKGDNEGISEAECMYRYLIEKGIEESRLIKEDQSADTYENLTNTKKIINEYNLNEKIAIVTSEYHEYRSSLIARTIGMESYAIPASTEWWLLPTYYVRELYGILYQWISNI